MDRSTCECFPPAELGRCEDDPPAPAAGSSGANSSNRAIICILRCRARSRPLTSLWRAAIHRMWSSNMNLATIRGFGGGRAAAAAAGPPVIDAGRSTVTCRQRLSSLSPVTSTS